MNTTTEFVTAVREVLQEPTAQVWTDTQLIRYLNWAKDLVWRSFALRVQGDWFITESDPISIVSDTQEYDLPTGMVRFVGLERIYQDADFLEKIPRNKRAAYEGVESTAQEYDYPRIFYLNPPKFGLVPEPTLDIADAVKVHYVARLADMVSGESWSTFEDYGIPELERLTVLRAAMMAKHLDETADEGVVAEYQDGLANIIHAYSQGGEDEEYHVPDPDRDW